MNVIQLEPKGMWSINWLEDLFSGPEFNHYSGFPDNEGAFVLVPAEYWADRVDELNERISRLPWAVVILASDEQGMFPVEDLVPVRSLWVMTPHFEKHVFPEGTNFMGEYYPADSREWISKATRHNPRPHLVSFSGQVTHERRYELVDAMEGTNSSQYWLNETAGFTQGLGRADYYQLLVDTEIVPAPSGPVTLDSFRAFEALEAGAVPVLDLVCPVPCDGELYWNSILGYHPLLTVRNWHELPELVDQIGGRLSDHVALSNQTFSWWQLHKRDMRRRILSSSPEWFDPEQLTILMPTSPVPSNPSLDKITQTIESVRFHHPTADILILCDGVRPEQEDRRSNYETFVSDLLWKANFEWTNVYPIVSLDFQHQALMTRKGLTHVNTELILYVEHDIPLVTDMPIDWSGITRLVKSGAIDVLKFSFEASGIHPEHEHMALDPKIIDMFGVPIRRTVQWSQRPNVARTDYYREIIEKWFPPTCRTMIEDKLHGVAQQFPEQFRLATYMPEGSKVRCYHIDGRETDSKFDMVYA